MPKIILKFALLLVIFIDGSGCGSISSQSQLMEKADVQNISRIELRNRLTSFTIYFAKIVETAADEIISKSEDTNIRMNVLRWKMNGIPASQYALFLNDPLAALIDVATFCIQMHEFFMGGTVKISLGSIPILPAMPQHKR